MRYGKDMGKYIKLLAGWLKERRNIATVCAILALLLAWRGWIELAGILVALAGTLAQWSINDPKKKLLDKAMKWVTK